MGSTSLEEAYADFRIDLSPSFADDEYDQEILIRRVTLALLVIYSIIFTLGIVGNGLVIFLLGFYLKKTVYTIWFLHLTVANFVFNCSLPLRITHNALKLHWPFGKGLCKLNNSIAYLNLYASAYFLVLVSVEHCASVRYPERAQNLRRNRLAWFAAWGVWFLALVFSSPRIHFGTAKPSPVDKDVIICFLSYGSDVMQANTNRQVTLICQCLFAFVFPVGVIIVCHVSIYKGQGPPTQGVKFFKLITAASVIFYLCWLPYHVFAFFETGYLQKSKALAVGIPVATVLAFVSSCVNPVLYIAVGYDFKERPRPSVLTAFGNVFGVESKSSRPKPPAKPATEMNPQDT